MGARAANAPELLWPAAAAAIFSTFATTIQMVVVLAATNIEVLRAIIVPLAFAGTVADFNGVAFAFVAMHQDLEKIDERGRAFSVKSAFIFATVLTLILLVSKAANEWFGISGVLVAAMVAGFADTHSAAISVATLANDGKMTPVARAIHKHDYQGDLMHLCGGIFVRLACRAGFSPDDFDRMDGVVVAAIIT
jgi:uncharacterized membrane protein (DUF4010 family)